jgi:hypothetical protein
MWTYFVGWEVVVVTALLLLLLPLPLLLLLLLLLPLLLAALVRVVVVVVVLVRLLSCISQSSFLCREGQESSKQVLERTRGQQHQA